MRASVALFLVCAVACSTKATGTSSSSGSSGSSGGTSGSSGVGGSSGTSGTGSSSGTSGGDTTSSSSGGDSCFPNVILVGPSWTATCTNWLDANCCAEEQTCANDTECQSLVGCIDSCNGDDTCIGNSCSSYGQTAIDELDALGQCTKRPGGTTIPATCRWP
jgi:hypothetical protein